MIREATLVGFMLLLIVIFAGAYAAGSRLGPVTTSNAQVSGPGAGGTSHMGGMNMGGSGSGGSQGPALAVRLRGGHP